MRHSILQQVMTREVVTAGPETPFKRMVELLAEHRISALPVVDGHNRVLGVVSEGDLLVKEEHSGQPERHVGFWRGRELRRKAEGQCARELMTAPAVTVPSTATVAEAARLMHARHIKSLPVVDPSGHLVGIASRVDLLGVFLCEDPVLADQVSREITERGQLAGAASVHVGATDGVVTLRGRLPRHSDVRRAGRLAAGVDGVVGVRNHLTFDYDDAQHESLVRPNW
jgi:CBS domain-containing protein